MKEIQKLLSTVRQAVAKYDMISEGDKIAVGVSGGKDSAALLLALSKMSEFYPKKYSVTAVSVDIGFPESDGMFAKTAEFARSLGVEYRIVKTEIYSVVFGERREKNPCSLCAMMRRGALLGELEQIGANKLALGHHYEDTVETFMLSLMHSGKMTFFSPVTDYADRGIKVIRPLIYTHEKDIVSLVNRGHIPVEKNPCTEDKHTEREKMKNYLMQFDIEHRGLYRRILTAIEKGGLDGWHE